MHRRDRARSSCPASSTPTATPGRPRCGASAPTGRCSTTSAASACTSRRSSSREDVYAGNYVGALEALDAGRHHAARLLALQQHAGARRRGDPRVARRGAPRRLRYGFYPVPLAEPRFADHAAAPRRRAAGARASSLPPDEGPVRMGIALTELGLVPARGHPGGVETARELDVLVTAHIGTVADSPTGRARSRSSTARGLLDRVRCTSTATRARDAELRLIADAGAAVSVTPETEMQMGMGFPITGRALALRAAPRVRLRHRLARQRRPVHPDAAWPPDAAGARQRRDDSRWGAQSSCGWACGTRSSSRPRRRGGDGPRRRGRHAVAGQAGRPDLIATDGLNFTPRPIPSPRSCCMRTRATSTPCSLRAGREARRQAARGRCRSRPALADGSRERI